MLNVRRSLNRLLLKNFPTVSQYRTTPLKTEKLPPGIRYITGSEEGFLLWHLKELELSLQAVRGKTHAKA